MASESWQSSIQFSLYFPRKKSGLIQKCSLLSFLINVCSECCVTQKSLQHWSQTVVYRWPGLTLPVISVRCWRLIILFINVVNRPKWLKEGKGGTPDSLLFSPLQLCSWDFRPGYFPAPWRTIFKAGTAFSATPTDRRRKIRVRVVLFYYLS